MQPSGLTMSADYDADDATLPGLTMPPSAQLRGIVTPAQRFLVSDAQLRLGEGRGCLAIGLYEARYARDPRLIILVVWRSALREPGVGRYRIQRDAPADGTFGVLAYLTYGEEWRCFEADRASEGRIAIRTMSEASVGGAFDVTFARGRFHGTFRAEQRDRRACFEPEQRDR
jgi:hypothetical protein